MERLSSFRVIVIVFRALCNCRFIRQAHREPPKQAVGRMSVAETTRGRRCGSGVSDLKSTFSSPRGPTDTVTPSCCKTVACLDAPPGPLFQDLIWLFCIRWGPSQRWPWRNHALSINNPLPGNIMIVEVVFTTIGGG